MDDQRTGTPPESSASPTQPPVFDSPLRRTTLSSLVDAASRAANATKPVRPATIGVVIALIGALAIGLGIWGALAGLPAQIVIGLALVFIGVTVGWAQMSFIMDDRLHPDAHTGKFTIVVTVASIIVTIVGVLAMFSLTMSLGTLLKGALAGLVMIAALAVIIAPWWISLIADLGMQRAQTAREELRADIAARLHDSVLQTLALIQLQSTDSAKVAALARAQERELREWLYGDPESTATASGMRAGTGGTGPVPASPASVQPPNQTMSQTVTQPAAQSMSAAQSATAGSRPVASYAASARTPAVAEPFSRVLKRIAANVEDSCEKPIDVVTVGECTYAPALSSLLDAAAEAMSNAARHGAPPISVYMEASDAKVQVFVRDHGEGFDVNRLPVGHLGVKESIIGRMRRAGGTAEIVSRPGWGTEVRLSQPI
ncbi:histidine kinase [Bifidobacterium callimiconis]|uniref:Histidine kinase n=2 Tax=Bifidobacterium callimiconis TaxID=2306973 RepID=A0A430FBT9_9BIFI|nr:histidine kinase [Bifidobacterium callimiconis]